MSNALRKHQPRRSLVNAKQRNRQPKPRPFLAQRRVVEGMLQQRQRWRGDASRHQVMDTTEYEDKI